MLTDYYKKWLKSVEFLINNGNKNEWSPIRSNNKMLESDWFLTAHIYSLIVLLQLQKLSDSTCPITRSL